MSVYGSHYTTSSSSYNHGAYNPSSLSSRYGYASEGSSSQGSRSDDPVRRLSRERIQQILGQPVNTFRSKIAAQFTPPSNESVAIQERILGALGGILTQNGAAKGFVAAVQRDFTSYLRDSSDIAPDSQRLWLDQLQSAFDAARSPIWASIVSTARNLKKCLQKACVTLTSAITKGLKVVMRVVRRSGEVIISVLKKLGNGLREVFAKLTAKTAKTDVLSLITDQNVRERLTPFMQQVLSHFKSKLDAIELLSQSRGNEKQSLIQALAAFLAQDGDIEFFVGYTTDSHVNRFNNAYENLLSPMMKEDILSINKALTEAFDEAMDQYTARR